MNEIREWIRGNRPYFASPSSSAASTNPPRSYSCTPFASTTFQLVYILPSATQLFPPLPWGCMYQHSPPHHWRNSSDVTRGASTAHATPASPTTRTMSFVSLPLAGVSHLFSLRSYWHIDVCQQCLFTAIFDNRENALLRILLNGAEKYSYKRLTAC